MLKKDRPQPFRFIKNDEAKGAAGVFSAAVFGKPYSYMISPPSDAILSASRQIKLFLLISPFPLVYFRRPPLYLYDVVSSVLVNGAACYLSVTSESRLTGGRRISEQANIGKHHMVLADFGYVNMRHIRTFFRISREIVFSYFLQDLKAFSILFLTAILSLLKAETG